MLSWRPNLSAQGDSQLESTQVRSLSLLDWTTGKLRIRNSHAERCCMAGAQMAGMSNF